jgi:HEPN domain-containing protein
MKAVEAWLIKAENDLHAAIKLMEGDDQIPDTAIYHAQQCAEKALKGYLTSQKHPLVKSHDVEWLVELCCRWDEEFAALYDYSEKLAPYATAFRYPDFVMEPDIDEVHEAIEMAEKILIFVKKKLPR